MVAHLLQLQQQVNLIPTHAYACDANRSSAYPSYGSLPTTTGAPECHSIFINEDGGAYRIYCNATIEGTNLRATTVSSFTNCIELCNYYNSTCIGSVYTNSSFPPICELRTSPIYTSAYKVKRDSPVSSSNGVFAALHLDGNSVSPPDDPSGYSSSLPGYSDVSYTASTSSAAYSTVGYSATLNSDVSSSETTASAVSSTAELSIPLYTTSMTSSTTTSISVICKLCLSTICLRCYAKATIR